MDDVVEVLGTVEKVLYSIPWDQAERWAVVGWKSIDLDRLLSDLILLWKDDGKLLTGFNGNL